jgi:AraC-like DNA-binding protein
MPLHSLESIATFEHFNLGLDAQSSVRLVNHRFTEDTVVEHIYLPGLYISMLGQCQCETLNEGTDKQRKYNHQYVVALADKSRTSRIHFANNSIWQTFAIMLPLNKLNEGSILLKPPTRDSLAIPNIRFAELGPIPADILRCCEAVWDCAFEGFERELFIKAKAQEVLALFLHKRREQHRVPTNSRITQLSNVLSHIQTNLAQNWSLTSVAHMAGSNRTYVKQDIKTLIGTNFRDWLRSIRLEAAREQLAGNEPITQIAHNVGFKSQAHFATLFKSEVGVTPSEYRQSLSIQRSA